MNPPFRAFLSVLFCAFLSFSAYAQLDTLNAQELETLTVKAFESQRNLLEAPSAIGLLTPKVLQRFAPTTWINAVNTIAGVRMEERSPGSYRFSVRGSLIRSPFGVRNVKFYWNGIPYTDASGNTPLNTLDFGAVQQMEILKGPGSSMYGAGTGGVVLMNTTPITNQNGQVEQTVGGGLYGLVTSNTNVQVGNLAIRYGFQQQNGYRDHSSMIRDGLTLSSQFGVGTKGRMSVLGQYSYLRYNTPGGLSLPQLEANPQASRPRASSTVPGAKEQNAGIYTRLVWVGTALDWQWNKNWSQNTSLYLTTNDFTNPFITNYEKRDEQGMGGRTVVQHKHSWAGVEGALSFGGEWQMGKSAQRNFRNDRGNPTSAIALEDLYSYSVSAFAQYDVTLPFRSNLSTGLSYNYLRYNYVSYFPTPFALASKTMEGVLMPRIALNKVFFDNWSAFATVSSGFSPPTLLEVRPSAGGFRQDLMPEYGLNREVGVRYFDGRLLGEVSYYRFGLNETIVRRSEQGGAEYFVNAGKTKQEGLEWQLRYTVLSDKSFLKNLSLWHSGTWTDYRYLDYRQLATDFSEKRLPGLPTWLVSGGVDVVFPWGIALFVTSQYSGSIFLNDANTQEAPSFFQLQSRLVWTKKWGKHFSSELSASAERVNASIYSLGYDLNAFGNRFYNAAPKENVWAGVKVSYTW